MELNAMENADASTNDTPLPPDTPLQLAIERRLVLLLKRRPGALVTPPSRLCI